MKWLNLLFLIPVLLGIMFFKNQVSGRKPPEKKQTAQAVLRVDTEDVEERALPRRLEGFGTVVTEREWTAVPQVSGKVVSVHPNLRTGGVISAGQVLFVIETIDQQLEQERILAEGRAMAAEIEQVQQRKKRLQAQLEAARGTLSLLQKEEARYQTLYEKGATPASTVDARRRDVLNQERAIKEIESNIATIPAQIDAVQARMSANRANLQKQGVQIGRSVVKAPFNGRLGEVYLEVGQVVSAGSQLFTMQGNDEVRIEARFPQAQLGQFPLKTAYVTTPSGRQVKANIGPLREQVDPVSRTASVQLTVSNLANGHLLPGALVGVVLEGESHEPRPVVPRSALHNRSVFLVEDGKLTRREIQVAFREGDFLAVESGLQGGEKLVVSDPGLAIEGTPVLVKGQEQ